ncbi:hypothetical protein [Yersinia bercovieri]|uniref:hypothetical protein n=1 Tax=Yersinia bercovieri TaxID=634 RepID=UPI000320CA0B|nr:hypothetical protein [Yersinia bercovieri]QKJ07055.1 hypothetical protein HRK25_09165 [Yersinia bercovieri ATCC 43970]
MSVQLYPRTFHARSTISSLLLFVAQFLTLTASFSILAAPIVMADIVGRLAKSGMLIICRAYAFPRLLCSLFLNYRAFI